MGDDQTEEVAAGLVPQTEETIAKMEDEIMKRMKKEAGDAGQIPSSPV